MVKRYENALYVFSVEMSGHGTSAEFALKNLPAQTKVEVLNENRSIEIMAERFRDQHRNRV